MLFRVPDDIKAENNGENIEYKLRKENIITRNNTKEYQHPGVWIMFGKGVYDLNWHCLNVGKNKNIGKELKGDFWRLEQAASKRPFVHEKTYYNQFGEAMFSYVMFPTRIDCLYSEINGKYTDVFAIQVCKDSDYVIEKYAAYLFKALYWVSNGKNTQIVDDKIVKEYLTTIKLSIEQKKIIEGLQQLKQSFDIRF